MDEQYRLLVSDLERDLLALAEHAQASTRRAKGDSAFADRCYTLAEAHRKAARIYEEIAEQIDGNTRHSCGEQSDG